MQAVRVLEDGRAAAWVLRRLRDPDAGTVDAVVPAGFAGYARLRHPVADRGALPPEQLAALCDVLTQHTSTPAECTFALPEQWPGAAGRASRVGTVRLAGADLLLVAGPLDAAVPLCFSDEPGLWWARSPGAFWPQDRTWCVVTAPGRPCTLVGASVAAVEDLLAAADLEAWPVRAADRLPAPS